MPGAQLEHPLLVQPFAPLRGRARARLPAARTRRAPRTHEGRPTSPRRRAQPSRGPPASERPPARAPREPGSGRCEGSRERSNRAHPATTAPQPRHAHACLERRPASRAPGAPTAPPAPRPPAHRAQPRGCRAVERAAPSSRRVARDPPFAKARPGTAEVNPPRPQRHLPPREPEVTATKPKN